MKRCIRCGLEDRFPSGECRACAKAKASSPAAIARARAKAATPEAKASKRAYRISAKGRAREAARAATPESKSKQRAKALLRSYGLTIEQHAAMAVAQGGKCAVCGDPLVPGHAGTNVDHDHHTGQVRGLLCRGCNSAEGQLRGSALRAEKLAAYLRKHAPKLRLA